MQYQLFPVIKAVVSDPRVIFTALFVIFYIFIVGKVVKYQKKIRPVKVKKSFAPPPEEKQENASEGESEAEA